MFTQVLCYAYNSISSPNSSIRSWFLNLVFKLNAQEPGMTFIHPLKDMLINYMASMKSLM